MGMDIPAALRQLVFERARGRCEYCLLPQAASAFQHEPDHITPLQHDGKTEASNLALACVRCNRHKGPTMLDHSILKRVRWSHFTIRAPNRGMSIFDWTER
jgi:5-methylcytosine-specific restriction endonuclease McrA